MGIQTIAVKGKGIYIKDNSKFIKIIAEKFNIDVSDEDYDLIWELDSILQIDFLSVFHIGNSITGNNYFWILLIKNNNETEFIKFIKTIGYNENEIENINGNLIQ